MSKDAGKTDSYGAVDQGDAETARPDPAAARKLPQYFAAVTAMLGALSMGTVVGWSSTAIEMIAQETPLTVSEKSWIGSSANLGGAVVMLAMPFLMARLGRRGTMLALAPPLLASWLLLALVPRVPALVAGRFLTGLFGGAYSVVGPVYNGEIAQKEIRGALGAFYQLFLCSGLLLAYLVGYAGSLVGLSLACAAVPAVLFVALLFVPESPLYLLTRGRRDEALEALRWLRGPAFDVQRELREAEQFVAESRKSKVGFREALGTRPAVRALVICSGVMMIQQLSGIKAVVFYTVTIFKDSGSSLDPYMCTLVAGGVLAGATGVSALVVDRCGRRLLLLLSGVGTTLCHAALGLYFHLHAHHPETAAGLGWLPLVSLCLYLITYTMGFGAVSWVLVGEMFPSAIKEAAGSFCAFVNWFLAFVVTLVFPYMLSGLGPAISFWLFSSVCLLGLLFVWFLCIETKGKTLEEIQKELAMA
ncbi:facilitated trehalose transporter Tret1-like [Bacillus rossius redtenbacheri]|uniref:facilitated trehalose transporter Tret1-like n=1 Tax=Bacillus rossius redtenbacheri TaxID=93214 RepID=UPI002FDE1889